MKHVWFVQIEDSNELDDGLRLEFTAENPQDALERLAEIYPTTTWAVTMKSPPHLVVVGTEGGKDRIWHITLMDVIGS